MAHRAELPERTKRMDPLLRVLGINLAIGAGVAVLLATVVLATDTAHLRTLIFSSSEPWIPALLLVFGFVVTMGSVAMGTAIMLLPSDDDDDEPPRGTRAPTLSALARVRAARRAG